MCLGIWCSVRPEEGIGILGICTTEPSLVPLDFKGGFIFNYVYVCLCQLLSCCCDKIS